MDERIAANENRNKEANIRSNENEQFSRKYKNIKVMDVPESKHETIPEFSQNVTELLKKENITLTGAEIIAMHRLPTKPGKIRPVIIKTQNNVTKSI